MDCDVAIIGGGPAGSTAGAMLRKYSPSLNVVVLEMERFPREHVGESLLPVVPQILNEMGAFDKVEAANFPIKVGARYRWGLPTDNEYWHFYFTPEGKLQDQPRPAKYEGQRQMTSFQVDRSIFDKILLDHAVSMGCRVFEQTKVTQVGRDGDRITHLTAKPKGSKSSERVDARFYIDASGGNSIVRRSMGVGINSPTSLRNIAVWDYWQDADWPQKVGIGGTLIQVMSIDWGWLWFIPITPTRTSIGLVTSAEYYKRSGKTTEQLYIDAIAQEPLIRMLVANAQRENQLRATKDWSFVADRLAGENWFLAGDACGFADPILSGGITLAMSGARRASFTILELMKGELDPEWLRGEYGRIQRRSISNHIRFADYWYSANSKFTDLKEYCTQIAKDAGLKLDADDAWFWLGSGGFADEVAGFPYAGTFSVTTIKQFTQRFSGTASKWTVSGNNIFELSMEGAEEGMVAIYEAGRVHRVPCFFRDGKTLPLFSVFGLVYQALSQEREIRRLSEQMGYLAQMANMPSAMIGKFCNETLEAMVADGWVKASYEPGIPTLSGRTNG